MTVDRDSTTAANASGTVTVRYWAAARAAAGTPSDEVAVAGAVTLAWVLRALRARHPGERYARTVGACSVLVDETPVSARDPESVVIRPGSTVELLPPFAGG